MGLIKSLTTSTSNIISEQWKEYFYCEALQPDVLATIGLKKQSKGSSNTSGADNIISNGSVIAVADGQCMLIVEQGKIVEVCAEPGEFVYDTSTEPSVLCGDFGEQLGETFMNVARRFTFGGETPNDQRVYYINTKELIGNKYGTPNPIPFRVVDERIGLDTDITIRCFGEYSYKIADPILFYSNVCGNFSYEYTKYQIEDQMKSELLTALQPAFSKISQIGVRYSEIPAHTLEFTDAVNDILSEKWQKIRGIKVVSMGISSITADEEDEDMIKELQRTAVLRDPGMAAARLTDAQAEAIQSAAANESTGAAMAFLGLGMANTAANSMNTQNLFSMGAEQNQRNKEALSSSGKPSSETWRCSCGASDNTGKFCAECGSPKPAPSGWKCTECGTLNAGKFCTECGAKKPQDALQYKCDKCGWEPDDPANPPKFCPECGDPFGNEDVKK